MSSLFDRRRMPEWPLEAAALWLSKEVCLVTPVGVCWQRQSHPSLSGRVRLPARGSLGGGGARLPDLARGLTATPLAADHDRLFDPARYLLASGRAAHRRRRLLRASGSARGELSETVGDPSPAAPSERDKRLPRPHPRRRADLLGRGPRRGGPARRDRSGRRGARPRPTGDEGRPGQRLRGASIWRRASSRSSGVGGSETTFAESETARSTSASRTCRPRPRRTPSPAEVEPRRRASFPRERFGVGDQPTVVGSDPCRASRSRPRESILLLAASAHTRSAGAAVRAAA